MVSADLYRFADVIRAYHRLLDLKDKYLNTEVLGVLVYGVGNNVIDSDGSGAGQWMQKARGLLGRVVAIYSGEGVVWELYASLAPMLILRAQRLQRAYRAYTKASNWPKTVSNCEQVLYVCHKLAEVALSPEVQPKDAVVQSVRLSLSSAIAAIKKQEFEETKLLLTEVSSLLGKIIEKVKTSTSTSTDSSEVPVSASI